MDTIRERAITKEQEDLRYCLEEVEKRLIVEIGKDQVEYWCIADSLTSAILSGDFRYVEETVPKEILKYVMDILEELEYYNILTKIKYYFNI